jgi:hypothetical protein
LFLNQLIDSFPIVVYRYDQDHSLRML